VRRRRGVSCARGCLRGHGRGPVRSGRSPAAHSGNAGPPDSDSLDRRAVSCRTAADLVANDTRSAPGERAPRDEDQVQPTPRAAANEMRRKSRKLVLWIGATILALLVIGTFAEPPEEAGEAPVAASDAPDAVEAAGEEPAAAKDDSPRTVEFGHEARVEANKLVVEGKTDLPDGVLVAWGGTGGGMIPDSTDAGQVTVADGRFAIRRW